MIIKYLLLGSIILFVLYLILKKTSKNTNKSLIFKSTDPLPSNINTIYTKLTTLINTLLETLGKTEISSGGIEGTLNLLNLKNIVSGTGQQNVSSLLPLLHYEYKDLILLNFAKNLNFSGTKLIVNPIINDRQILTLNLTAKAKELLCGMSIFAHMAFLGSTIQGDCDRTFVKFHNVVCNIEIQIVLTNCDKLISTISDLILTKLELTFSKVDIECELTLNLFDVIPYRLADIDLTKYLQDTIKNNLYRVKDALAPIFNSQFKGLNLPSLPCINLRDGCFPGIDINSKDIVSTSTLDDITWNECKDICDQNKDCNYSYFNYGADQGDNKRGLCVFLTTKYTTDAISRGRYYDKQKNVIINNKIPVPIKQPGIKIQNKEFGNIECQQVCKSNNLCKGFSFENGICSMYQNSDIQNFTLDLSKCQRNINNFNTFK